MSADQGRADGGFGELLRQHRRASGFSQEELAERTGLSVRTIANLERGRTARPHRRSVRLLADGLALPQPQREQLDRASRRLAHGDLAHGDLAPGVAGAGQVTGGARPALPMPRQLPAAVPHFVGRSDELTALTAAMNGAGGAATAVVISAIGGTAGVGKTALAVHWAHQVADRFPDGQLYVNLRGYDSGRQVSAADALAGVLRALGVAGQDIPAETDERAACYRSLLAGRSVLVLLDNAGAAEQVRPLLPGTPGCMAVVTSRDAMAGLVARDGARRLDLDMLPLAEAIGLLRVLIGGRVDDDQDSAAALARQCCRLPLALRLAAELAVNRPAVPLTSLVGELADQQRRLDLLDADGDQRTAVRAVFYWSYRQLDVAAARAFRLIGLHPGRGFDSYAAAALTGTSFEHVEGVLFRLARAHLVHTARQGWHSMHDLLRAYARDLAVTHDSQRERDAAMNRLFDYYLHTACVTIDTLFPASQRLGPATPPATGVPAVTGPAQARAWLDAHLATLAAISADAADCGWPAHATRLATILFRYLEGGAHYAELVAIQGHAIRAARRVGDRAAEAEALNNLSIVDLRQGRYGQAADRLRQALEAYRAIGNETGEAWALGNLGITCYAQGDYTQAVGHHNQALEIYLATGDRTGEARTLVNLGLIDLRQGRYQQSTARLQRALLMHRERGDLSGEAYILGNLGLVDLRQGRYEQAARRLHRSLVLFRDKADPTGEADALSRLAAVELRQGCHQQADSHLRQALSLSRRTGNLAGEAEALNGLGEALLAVGDPGQARRYYRDALGLASQIGDKYEQARAHDGIAHSYQANSDLAQTRTHWQEAFRLFTAIGAPEAAQVLAGLAAGQP